MGNEGSQLSGLKIEEKAVEHTDFWVQYQAFVSDRSRHFSLKCDGSVSIFKGQPVQGPLWTTATPLEKCSQNLMKYRHPCIVHYLSSWKQGTTFHLATEFVQPLSQVLPTLTPLQICVGLNNILRALMFLHDDAKMSHNNVCKSAVYVTGDGQWKLGGLQYLHGLNDLTTSYLKHAQIHRYDKAVDPSEDTHEDNSTVDQYAFAVLVKEAFNGCNEDEVPDLSNFKRYCEINLQHNIVAKRPNFSEVLQHNLFNHDFVMIYKFLNLLPLKSEIERREFFTNVLGQLAHNDEETVAKQFSGLLLSRLALLDETARVHVVPYLLKPRIDKSSLSDNNGFFNLDTFKAHVKPRLLQLFTVRDLQLRKLLLLHFSKFVNVFTHEELSNSVLPELLLGIKDTDDALVAATLVCLSELTPILGADAVVGGKRSKLFSDGRPNSKLKTMSLTRNDVVSEPVNQFSNSNVITPREVFNHLSERPAPVGGEDVDDEPLQKRDVAEDDWSDWESSSALQDTSQTTSDIYPNHPVSEVNPETIATKIDTPKRNLLQKASIEAKKRIIDIADLDIKNQKNDISKKDNEIDFFADMEPVLGNKSPLNVEQREDNSFGDKLSFIPNDDVEVGWEEESWND